MSGSLTLYIYNFKRNEKLVLQIAIIIQDHPLLCHVCDNFLQLLHSLILQETSETLGASVQYFLLIKNDSF